VPDLNKYKMRGVLEARDITNVALDTIYDTNLMHCAVNQSFSVVSASNILLPQIQERVAFEPSSAGRVRPT